MALPKLNELKEEREHTRRSAKDITDKADKDGRTLTAEELVVFDQLVDQVKTLDTRIQEVVDTHERRDRVQKLADEAGKTEGRTTSPDQPVNAITKAPARAKRFSTLKAFKGVRAEDDAYRSGMWARANLFGDERAQRWCHSNGVMNTLATNDNASGGVLVPEEFSQAIIDLREEFGVFRKQVRVVPMGSDTMLIPRRVGGVTVSFVGENQEILPSDPSWNQVRLVAKKVAGMTKMSAEIDEDAIIDLADWLAGEFAYAFAIKEDSCGFNGDGTSAYGGMMGLTVLLNGGSGLAGAVDATSGHDTLAEVDATDLGLLMAKLPAYARMNAKWYGSTVALDLIFGRLMANAGGNTISDVERGYQPRYLGYPIVISQTLQTSTGNLNNEVMLLFGDLRLSTTMGDRRGIRVTPSEHRYFEMDQIAIKATERFDIVNHDVGSATVAGPVVALNGNT